jgi:2-polyprenyl-6-methoxyphenol hydroxylase-like FAD-dependent oxidoreductase
MPEKYDVIIIGGGPAGATLGAILGRHTALKVGLFEQEFFPREHIGESLISVLVPVLTYSGVLPKLLQSDCYIGPKPGGMFAWDPGHEDPWCLTFNNEVYEQLGIINFSVHVNRSEFDKLLLDHAREMGVEVREGVSVAGVERDGQWTRVRLDDGSQATCRILVEASGRVTSVTGIKKQFLSDYKNIAIWNHFVGGKAAGDLPGDWNIFRSKRSRIDGLNGEEWSPIACFACDDGWFWYIPVPKMVMGKRVRTHSVGLVTDPKILATSPEKRYTDMDVFLAKVRQVPLLCDLMADARAISDKVLTTTNYSMISDRICDYDQKWILLGDAAFFVDPLFSTGVALALLNAATVSFLITATLDPSLPEQSKRDLWYDYQQRMHTSALTLSICVDQWYHGIARKNPGSIYWRSRRGEVPTVDLRYKTFHMLGNAEVTNPAEYDYTGDRRRWIEALTHFSPSTQMDFHFMKKFWQTRSPQEADLRKVNPLDGLRASDPHPDALILRAEDGRELAPETKIALRPDVAARPSLLLGQVDVRKMVPPEYWQDPLKHAGMIASFPPYYECLRFHFKDRPDEVEVPYLEDFEDGQQVLEALQGEGRSYGELKQLIGPGQRSLVGRLQNAGMLVIE